jgi:S-adenosylmethionine hydrolase
VRTAWPRFPAGTIHMVVVDPGVGSARRALAVAHGQHVLLAPDNGVLSWLLGAGAHPHAVAIDPLRLAVARPSATFHGRDVFAPAAARLACGAALDELGPTAHELVQLAWPVPQRLAGRVRGEIIHIDRFGNLISNLPSGALTPDELGRAPHLHLDDGTALPLVRCYADAPAGALVALVGSSDFIEVAVRDASAQAQLGAHIGSVLWLEHG